jgi:hypothetical protein
VHVGDPDALPAALHLRGAEGVSGQAVDGDATRTLALALLQADRADEALALMVIRDEPEKVAHADAAALALMLVACGRADEASDLGSLHRDAGTYLDALQTRTALAFAKLQQKAPDAEAAFDALVEAADATESRLDQAVARLARLQAWRSLGRPDQVDAERDMSARLQSIGAELSGWARAFERAATAVPAR